MHSNIIVCMVAKVLHTFFYLSGIQMNPYAVSPSFDFWAPWIGERTRRSAVALNTEFQKLQTPKAPGENAECTVTEDHLLNELLNQEVCAVWILKVTSFIYWGKIREEMTKPVISHVGWGGQKTMWRVWPGPGGIKDGPHLEIERRDEDTRVLWEGVPKNMGRIRFVYCSLFDTSLLLLFSNLCHLFLQLNTICYPCRRLGGNTLSVWHSLQLEGAS